MTRVSAAVRETAFRWLSRFEKAAGFPAYALLLLVVMTAAYNLQVLQIGYYYDDWEGVFIHKQLFSAQQAWEYFLIDRPFYALMHQALNPLLGSAPVGWRIAGMLVHWGAVLLIVRSLQRIWPRRILEIGWIGLLLAVYPGISRQFVIRTSIGHYLSMLLFAASVLLMIRAVQELKYRRLLVAAAVILAVLQVLIIEYYAGLELIRIFLLFYIFRRSSPSAWQAARKTLFAWLPYALVFAAFLLFRLVILPQIQMEGMVTKNTPKILTQFLANPPAVLLRQFEIILQDSVYAVIYVWSQVIAPESIDLQARATMASWFIGALVALAAGVFMLAWQRKTSSGVEREPFPSLVLILCFAAILLGGLPIWAVGRQATQGLWASRYLFAIVTGAVPLVVIFFAWATGQQRRFAMNIILAALLMGSVAFQFRTGNKYALTWHYARQYFWQMKWRAPSLQPGTFILSPYTPFQYSADYQIAFAINVLYATGNHDTRARYWWFDGPDDLLNPETKSYRADGPVKNLFRTISFESSMQQALPVMFNPARGCLQVVDPVYAGEPLLLPEEMQLFPAANPGLIGSYGDPVPEDTFGKEPPRDWCYFYQTGDLARTQQQWQQAAAAWEQANARALQPRYGPEYLPFIEAYARLGDWERSFTLTKAAFETSEKMEPFLCHNWERIIDQTPNSAAKQQQWQAVKGMLGCGN